MLDSLVRVSRRVDEKHFVHVPRRHDRKNGPTVPFPSPMSHKAHEPATGTSANSPTASHRFLSSNFRYYFTLFSKCFSSFPHGTCSLLVSRPYLALDGIYHPLELQSQTTRLFEEKCWTVLCIPNGAITLHGVPSQTTSMQRPSSTYPSADYIPEGFSLSFSRFTRRY
jgi:hypothetical protein